MKQFYFGLAVMVASALLQGCEPDEVREPAEPSETRPIFKPSSGNLPLPNDILFGGTTDLTLNIPGIADEEDFSNPMLHLSSIDGWGTSSPFNIQFETVKAGVSLDPSTLVVGEGIRIFKVLTLAQAVLLDADPENDVQAYVPGTNIQLPTSPPVAVMGELTAEDFAVRPYAGDESGLTIEIVPLKPFESRTSYVVVLTNSIQDTEGEGIVPDLQYGFAKAEELPPLLADNETFQRLNALVNQIESVVSTSGLDPATIAVSMQFTTQNTHATFDAIRQNYLNPASPLAPLASTTTGNFAPKGTVCTYIATLCVNPADGSPLPELVDIYQGEILLPYMLEAPTGDPATFASAVTGFWQALEFIPGTEMPNPLGRNLTYGNSTPQIKSYETAPVIVTLPKADAPAEGYPVMIFQHGITSNRTNALLIARAMAARGIAVVAIDLPQHGLPLAEYVTVPEDTNDPSYPRAALTFAFSQAFVNQDYNPLDEARRAYTPGNIMTLGTVRERTFHVDLNGDNVPDSSGSNFIALPSPLTVRDNLRQGAFDLMTVVRAIPGMKVRDPDAAAGDFDESQISFMGHSLGGIIGGTFVSNEPSLTSAIIANASGMASRTVEQSLVFGPTIQAGLEAAGRVPGTAGYDQFFWLAQAVTDAGDPINYVDINVADQTPTLLIQMEGDVVVINDNDTFPLVGTEVLGRMWDLAVPTTEDLSNAEGVRGFLRYDSGPDGAFGSHGTVLTPSSSDPTDVALWLSMQGVISEFVQSQGTLIPVSEQTASLLEAPPAK